MKILRSALMVLLAFTVSSCAQYSIKTDKASDQPDRLDKVFVWSAIGSVTPFTRTLLFSDDTFENQFNSALTTKLASAGIKNSLRRFSPGTDSETDLGRFESELEPAYRLLVVSPRYTTITARDVTNVDILYLDVILKRTKDNKQVWRSEIVINANTAPGSAWRQPGAEKLAEMIINALRKDGLL